MKTRCFNPRNVSYRYYGARGITVCERWLSFDAFLEDMGERPKGATIDRIDSNRNYEPGNCRWLSVSKNSARARSKYVTFDGQTVSVSELARLHGIKPTTLNERLVSGMSVADALSMPVRKYASNFLYIGRKIGKSKSPKG